MSSTKEKEKAPEVEKKSPMVWGHELCMKKHGNGPLARELPSPLFECARAIYGWDAQVHHFGPDSFQISKADFEAGLEAAGDFPARKLHLAAVPPVSIERLKAKAK